MLTGSMFLSVVLIFALYTPRTAATQEGESYIVSCGSGGGGRECDTPFRRIREVRLERQLSGAPCVQGTTWGVRERSIWVTSGCRAEFRVWGWRGDGDDDRDDNRDRDYDRDRERDQRPEGPVRAAYSKSFIVRCASDEEQPVRCHLTGGVWNVQLERQVSGSPCVAGQTWGFDNDEIWVDRGCRADFRVWAGGFAGAPVIVACNSDDERLHRCHLAEGIWNVRLRKQYSGSPCILGESWGFDDDDVWVDRGCRADFLVWAGGGFAGRSSVVRCKSDDEHLNRCHIAGGIVNVRLELQNSGSPCMQGQTWGFDDDDIWVDRGCRADFRVWTRR